MNEYVVLVYYPYKFARNGGEHRWLDTDFRTVVEAENQSAANAIVQKKIDDGEFDGSLGIPEAVTGQNDIDLPVRPYIVPTETKTVVEDEFLNMK